MSYHGFLAVALILPFADADAFAGAEPKRVAWLIFGSVLLAGLGSLVFTRGLQIIGAIRASMLAYLEPLVAVVVGFAVWNERHSPVALLGGLLILAAGLCVSTRRT